MCSMPFDISKFAKGFDVSESDTELREIPLDKIRENPENFYPPLPEDEAEALRESIQANGLLEPLLVVPDGATYRLVSGHNRLRALRDLRANAFGMDYKTALCRVLPPMDADHEITAIIEANRQRKKTPAVLQQEAEALTEVYVRRKQAGEELPGRIRDRVAEAMQVSATKLANLNAIKNGIREPNFASAWASGNISEACALEIARMDAESQHQLAVWLEDEREPCALSLVREFNAISHKLDHDCKLAGMPCPNARAMYKAFVRHGTWEGCCGCCSCCLRRDTCSVCCQYVQRKAPAPVDEPVSEPAPPISEPKARHRLAAGAGGVRRPPAEGPGGHRFGQGGIFRQDRGLQGHLLRMGKRGYPRQRSVPRAGSGTGCQHRLSVRPDR